jgi:hypothetical protein
MRSPQAHGHCRKTLPPLWPARTTVRAGLHSFLARYPALFIPYMRLRGRRTELLANGRTEIVIEGYPRSGNTFAVVAFRLAQNRDVRIAHHLHAPAQVIWAARQHLPAMVLIRKPADAVLSLLIRDPSVSVTHEFRRYTRFYSALGPYRNDFVLAAFEEVVSDFGPVIARVNAKFGTAFDRFEHTEDNVHECFRMIEELNAKHGAGEMLGEHTVARPSAQRERAKEHLAQDLRSTRVQPLLARANKVHDRLLYGP